MRRLACIALGLLLLIVVTAGFPSAVTVPARVTDPTSATEELGVREWEGIWTSVLIRYVDNVGRIDFAGLTHDHADLDRVVAFVAAIDPISRPQEFSDRNSRLAFYINAYNALAMYGIVDAGVPQNLGGLRKFGFFYLRKFVVGGKSISLYDLENKVVRPLGEERVHFALNCMVVGCPRLPRAAFSVEDLDRELDAAAHLFIQEERNVSVDPVRHEVRLSAIFDFYTSDFLKRAPSLIAYVNRYRADPIPSDFKVRFFDYDWTVNSRDRVGASRTREM